MVEERRVEQLEVRVEALSRRLDVVEGRSAAVANAPRPPRPEPPRRPAPVAVSRPAPRPEAPAPAPRPAVRVPSMTELAGGRSFEDLLGGRVLAWVGGLAVLMGIAFLFAVAVSSGWIGEGARTLIAGAGSAGLLALGVWLHERRGRTDAALAAVATGIAALFVTITVGSQTYEVLPAPVALALALGVGSLATGLAVRWEAQGIAGLGIVGALVSPVLAGGEAELGTIAILLVAAGSAVGVLLRQRWQWLSYAVFALTLPQVAAFLGDGEQSAATTLAVLTGFGLVNAAAAVGYELRVAAKGLRTSSAFLLCLNAFVLALGGYAALEGIGDSAVATAWLWGVGGAHVLVGLAASRSARVADDFGLLSLALGTVGMDVAFSLTVSGPVRSIGFAGAGVLFAALVRRRGMPANAGPLAALGVGAHVGVSLVQALTTDAPPSLLSGDGVLTAGALAAVVGVAAGCFVSARLAEDGYPALRVVLDVAGLALVAYLAALTLDGWQLSVAWSIEAVALGRLAARDEEGVAGWGAGAHLILAACYTIAEVAPLDGADPLAAAGALGSVAAATALLSRFTTERELRGLLEAVATAAVAYLAVVLLDGEGLVVALAAGSAVLVELARRDGSPGLVWSAVGVAAMAAVHAVAFEAPPAALVAGLAQPGAAVLALGAVALATLRCARLPLTGEHDREVLSSLVAVTLLYLASVLVVTPFQPGNPGAEAALLDLDVRQQGQVALSALWGTVGFVALVLGLRRDLRLVRLGALTLLLVTVGKVFLFDLATLTSIYRVMSFIGLGLFLLTAAFVWQRLRPRDVPDMRKVPEGVR